jgi:cell division protein FtsQ
LRRPAALPAPAQEPAEVAPEARTGRRVRAGEQEPDARRAAEAAAGESGSAEAGSAEAGSAEAGIDAPVRSSDVWRAARARRRALRAEIRRFTQRSRRRRLVWWCSIGAVLALILGSVVAAYSPLFAVERITVAGARGVDAAAVQQALRGQIGSPLALIDQSAVKSALTQFPMIESYALEARPPHELLVRIVERTPVGVLSSDAGYSLVDAAGVVLATTEKKPDGQPVLSIDGGTSGAAFRSAGLVIRSLPADLRSQLKQVAATSADDVTLTLQDGRGIVWGSADESAQKAIVLVALMKGAPGGHTFDVSAPTVPVVR